MDEQITAQSMRELLNSLGLFALKEFSNNKPSYLRTVLEGDFTSAQAGKADIP